MVEPLGVGLFIRSYNALKADSRKRASQIFSSGFERRTLQRRESAGNTGRGNVIFERVCQFSAYNRMDGQAIREPVCHSGRKAIDEAVKRSDIIDAKPIHTEFQVCIDALG